MTWRKSNELYTHADHSGPTVIFCGDATSGGPPHYPWGQWSTVDLKPLGVAADALFADIAAHLIISDLTDFDIENLTATYRKPGSTQHEGNYQMQAVSVFKLDGTRGTQFARVPLVNGCFEFFWNAKVGGQPEAQVNSPSSFLINAILIGWGRWQAPTPAPTAAPQPAPQVIRVPAGGMAIQFIPDTAP